MSLTERIAKRLGPIVAFGVVGAILFFVGLESRSVARYSVWFNIVASAIFGVVIIGLGMLGAALNRAATEPNSF